jgi:hypothetical protein
LGLSFFQGRYRDVDESNTGLHEGLRLLGVLTLTDVVTSGCKIENLEDQALCDFVKIDEKTSGISVHIKCLVQISSMVDLGNELDYDV